jgi:glycosyltransferase involved in cell wall biosynthesis
MNLPETQSLSANTVDITIAVCTRNRGDKLVMCLESITCAIENQDRSVEAIIVDNGSTDNTKEVAQEWAASSRFPARVITEGRPGLSVARNAAIRNARGEIVVFTDDDCTLSSDYLAKLSDHYQQDLETVVRGGRVELGNRDDVNFTTKTDPQSARLVDIARVAGFILGCNMALPRAAIARIGYFDESFGAGAVFRSAEETDFMCRAYIAGIPIEYVPDMIVYHHHGRRSLDEIQKLFFNYCVGNGAMYAKYCSRERRLLRHLYWDIRNAIAEMFGGRVFDRGHGLTYHLVVRGNLVGLLLYKSNRLKVIAGFAPKSSPATKA